MEKLVRFALAHYKEYRAEAAICEATRQACADPEQERAMKLVEIKLAIISGWFALLNSDETFVVTTHLVDEVEWARVVRAFEMKWGMTHGKAESTLRRYQRNALKKINEFSTRYSDVIFQAFGCTDS